MKHEKKICNPLPLESFKDYAKEILMNSSQKAEVISVGMSIIVRMLNFLVKAFGKLPEIELDGFFIHQVNLLENQNQMFMEKYLSMENLTTSSTIQQFKLQQKKLPQNSKQ